MKFRLIEFLWQYRDAGATVKFHTHFFIVNKYLTLSGCFMVWAFYYTQEQFFDVISRLSDLIRICSVLSYVFTSACLLVVFTFLTGLTDSIFSWTILSCMIITQTTVTFLLGWNSYRFLSFIYRGTSVFIRPSLLTLEIINLDFTVCSENSLLFSNGFFLPCLDDHLLQRKIDVKLQLLWQLFIENTYN